MDHRVLLRKQIVLLEVICVMGNSRTTCHLQFPRDENKDINKDTFLIRCNDHDNILSAHVENIAFYSYTPT